MRRFGKEQVNLRHVLARVAALGVMLDVCRSLVLPWGLSLHDEASSRDRQREDEWTEEAGVGLKGIEGNPAV